MPLGSLSVSVCVTVIKHHKLGGLYTRNLFLTILEAGTSRF